MDETEARLLLRSYRADESDRNDPQFAAALEEAARNRALGEWFAEEQAFDRAMAAHLDSVPAPFGLKTRILAQAEAPRRPGIHWWSFALAGLAALIFLFAPIADMWRTSLSAADLPADYSREMISFVQLTPPLEMETHDVATIKNWLGKKETGVIAMPPHLAELEPLGCRVLSFRRHDVTLICFRREGKRLAHLFVIDRAAMPKMKAGGRPTYLRQGEWMTAMWVENDRIYMLAMQSGRAAMERYLPDA
jgi:hypothetical protein